MAHSVDIQALLDREAQLSNAGNGKSPERQELLTMIRLARDEAECPSCFGEDDCSTNMLMRCPWRIDCGGTYD